MADLALVFGWTPDEMSAMSLPELMDWRERARQRHQPEQ